MKEEEMRIKSMMLADFRQILYLLLYIDDKVTNSHFIVHRSQFTVHKSICLLHFL